MARCGIISKDLSTVDPPTCFGYANGKARRHQWRHKGIQNKKKTSHVSSPGAVVSLDQLISPTPYSLPIQCGLPATKRYVGTIIFVDHYLYFTYCHVMTEMTAVANVANKEAFERISVSHNVCIRNYHCGNGLFDTKAFKYFVIAAHQTISFCSINTHHQNGKAKRCMDNITIGNRTFLLHASHRLYSCFSMASSHEILYKSSEQYAIYIHERSKG